MQSQGIQQGVIRSRGETASARSSDGLSHAGTVKAFAAELIGAMGRCEIDIVREHERIAEGILHDLTGGGVATWLEASDEAMLRITGA